jgi:hypothetical protein
LRHCQDHPSEGRGLFLEPIPEPEGEGGAHPEDLEGDEGLRLEMFKGLLGSQQEDSTFSPKDLLHLSLGAGMEGSSSKVKLKAGAVGSIGAHEVSRSC